MPVMGITLYDLYTLENLLQKRAYYDHIFRQGYLTADPTMT